MGVMSYIREKKEEVSYKVRAKKSRAAWERAHPDEAIKELKEEKRMREQRAEVQQLKAEARKEKFKAVAGFFAGPTVAAAEKEKIQRKSNARRIRSYGSEMQPINSAFGLGASPEAYNLEKPNVFGRAGDNSNGRFSLGGSKPNSAFSLGPEKRRAMPKKKRAQQTIIVVRR